VICLALALTGILSRVRQHPGPVRVESVLIIAVYALGAWLLASPAR
jgi:hypothetical protein